MWELDYKESWVLKNWCFWTVVLEKTLESPLDYKENKPVNTKGNQSWLFIGRADAEAEAPILWPPDVKSWLIWKGPDAGKDWRCEKGMTEDEMVGWYHWINGHEFEQALGAGDGQRGLACCSPWGHKELDTTEQLKNSNKILPLNHFPPAARNSHSMLKMPNLFLPQDLCITILSAWNLSSQKIFTWLVHLFYSFLYTSLPRSGLLWHPTCSYLQAHHSLPSCPALISLTPLITGEIIL